MNTVGGQNGLAGVGFTAGAHLAHNGSTFGPAENLICYRCHYNGMPFTSICGNTQLQIGFNVGSGGGAGTTYDGSTTLNSVWTYNGNNGTTITQSGTMICSTIYCHGNGTGATLNTAASGTPPLNDPRPVVPGNSPAWNSSVTLACNACHGAGSTDGRPSYAQDAPKANGHLLAEAHVLFTCDVCHYDTTHDGVTIFDATKHAYGVYDLAPNPNATGLNGLPVNFSYTYDPGGGLCSTVSCHSNGTFTWGNGNSIYSSFTFVQQAGPANYEMTFSGAPGNALNCNWNFGDGAGSSSCAAVEHIYSSKGPYTVTLNGRDQNYHIFSASAIAGPTVSNIPPVVSETFSVNGYTVTLVDSSTSTVDPQSSLLVAITWGDGGTTNGSAGTTFTHTYTKVGTNNFSVNETVTDTVNGLAAYKSFSTGALSSAAVMSGTVTSSKYGPLGSVTVGLKINGVTQKSTTTATDGTYSMTGLYNGTCNVSLYRSGFTFTPANTTVTFSGNTITGTTIFTATP